MVSKNFLLRPRKGRKIEFCKLNTELRVIYEYAPVSISLPPLTLSTTPYAGDSAPRQLTGQVGPQPTVLSQTALTWRPLHSPHALDDAAGRHATSPCTAPPRRHRLRRRVPPVPNQPPPERVSFTSKPFGL